MNRNHLKLVAAIAMFLDHFAVYLLPSSSSIYVIFRIIGRLAFVLFGYMVAEGFFKTSNIKKYWLRLGIFAIGIEVFILIYYLVSDVNYLLHSNVIWPLFIGLSCIILLDQKTLSKRLMMLLPVSLLVFLAEYLDTPYGAYGPLMIIIFAMYRNNKFTQLFMVIGLNLIFIATPLQTFLQIPNIARYSEDFWFQWFSLLAFVFIFLYNGQKGKLKTKWFFYIFYPLHLGVIYLISYFL